MVDRTYNEDEGDSFTDSDNYMTDDAKPVAPPPEEDYGAETIDRIMDYRKGKVGSKYYYSFFLKSKVTLRFSRMEKYRAYPQNPTVE